MKPTPELNSEQQAAVAAREGAFRCLAIPGSGKTEVFAQRARRLLREGCRPEAFLGLTFNKEAALEFESRSDYKPGPTKPKIFRTFHGFALDLVTNEYKNFPFTVQRWPLLTPQDQFHVLLPIVKRAPRRVKYKDVLFEISQFKRQDLSPDAAADKASGEYGILYAELYADYEAKCRQLGKLDFDSLMVESVRLLDARPEIRARWQVDYLQNDEAQDNDTTQWRLIQLLTERSGNVFAVGDPNQAMYAWRAAEPDGLTVKFQERFPNARTLVLPQNYRSTKAIVDYCASIAPNPVDMRTGNAEGTPPTFRRYNLEDDEAKTILSNLTDPTCTAIIARTNRQLAAFERLCGEMEIKYCLLGKSGFFHQEEVQNTLAFAQYFVNPTDAVIKQIIRSPYECSRFIRKGEAIEALENTQRGSVGQVGLPFSKLLQRFRHPDQEQARRVLDLQHKLDYTAQLVRGKSAENALRNILTEFGILHHYVDDPDAIDNNPGENVRTLLRMTEKHGTLLEFVNACLKAKQASRSHNKRLTLSTIHQAKGKEWKYVHVVGVNLDILPHKSGDLEEERRIYFVACSRAADYLAVSCHGEASPFIKKLVVSASTQQEEVDALDMMYRRAGMEA